MKHRPTQENNFIWLLIALVMLVFCSALFAQMELRFIQRLINLTLMVTMIGAVWSLHSRQGKWFKWKLFMSGLITTLMVVDSVIESNMLAPVQLIVLFVFLAYTIFAAWEEVMFTGQITRNQIVGAICIYFLIGMIFGFAYLIVEYFAPGSMIGLGNGVWQEDLGLIFYYSMVTLTTVGYGDIIPAAPLTRFLAYMEATTGIFYTTVLVASLIGMRLSGYRPDPPK